MRSFLIGATAAIALLAPVTASAITCLPNAAKGNWTLLANGPLVDRDTGELEPTAWSCTFYIDSLGITRFDGAECTDGEGVRGGVTFQVGFWDTFMNADCSTHPSMRFETGLHPVNGMDSPEDPDDAFFCWVRGQMTNRKDMIVGVLDCRDAWKDDGTASFVMVRK